MFLCVRDQYHIQLETCERLEDFHIAITGNRCYSTFDSFWVLLMRLLFEYLHLGIINRILVVY